MGFGGSGGDGGGGDGGGSGGGVFLMACEDLGGGFDESFTTSAFFLLPKWRSARAQQFRSFSEPTVAQRSMSTVDERSLPICV